MIKSRHSSARTSAAAACVIVALTAGCRSGDHYYRPPPAPPLGALSDPVWQDQEANAEPAELMVYQHEFEPNTEWLNLAGEDHLKEIAAGLQSVEDLFVIVERSMASPPPGDAEYPYPVYPNPELDMRRREIVVRCLAAMGIADADQRVVVAPAFAQGITGNEAEASYQRGLGGAGFGAPGLGGAGGFGGFMFRGGI